jgi:transcriptional regulator with XRE-family HTH domain
MQLKKYLEKKKITQVRFAYSLNTSAPYLHRVINKNKLPSIGLARKIEEITEGAVSVAELFDIDIEKLFRGLDNDIKEKVFRSWKNER